MFFDVGKLVVFFNLFWRQKCMSCYFWFVRNGNLLLHWFYSWVHFLYFFFVYCIMKLDEHEKWFSFGWKKITYLDFVLWQWHHCLCLQNTFLLVVSDHWLIAEILYGEALPEGDEMWCWGMQHDNTIFSFLAILGGINSLV